MLLLCLLIVLVGRFGSSSALGQPDASIYTAIHHLQPNTGLLLPLQHLDCDLSFTVATPQHAIYLGSASTAGQLLESAFCRSAQFCTGSFSRNTGPKDLAVISTSFFPGDAPAAYSVAVEIAVGPECEDRSQREVHIQPVELKLYQQLLEAGSAAEALADPRRALADAPVPVYPIDPPDSKERRDSTEILKAIDFIAPHVALKTFPNGMRGLQATKLIEAGEDVGLFPWSKSLKIDNHRGSSPLPKLIPDSVWQAHFWRQYPFSAAIVLAKEMRHPRSESMKRYLEMLPQAVDMPWQWSSAELDELQEPAMTLGAVDQYHRMSSAWHVLNSNEVAMGNVSWEDFTWACNIILSRSFGMDCLEGFAKPSNKVLFAAGTILTSVCGLLVACFSSKRRGLFRLLAFVLLLAGAFLSGTIQGFLSESGAPAHYIGLLPGIDLYNHQALAASPDIWMSNPGQPEQWSWKQPLDRFVRTTAAKDLLPGQEIFISYGGKSNSDLLGGYGFLVPGNVFDTYILRNFAVQMMQGIASGIAAPSIPIDSPLTGTVESAGTPTLGLLGVNTDDMTHLQDLLQPLLIRLEDLEPGLDASEHSALASWKILAYACQEELNGKPTSLEEDEALLQAAGAEITFRYWSALQLRMGHKRLLQHCINQAQNSVVFLQIQQRIAAGQAMQGHERAAASMQERPAAQSKELHSEL